MTDQDGGRSPGSTIAASELDDRRTAPSSPARADPRTSLQHVLGHPSPPDDAETPLPVPSSKPYPYDDLTEDEQPKNSPSVSKPTTATKAKGRGKSGAAKEAGGASIYGGNKVKHLKKDDGEPLWRKDIQYDFLKAIFDNPTKCFTNSYEPDKAGLQTFSDVYIDAMARSSKTSKILRDKLLSDNEPAKNMAMVCLLVNLGRMNTTLNFFPEMRAQLRTYHAIPSLQAHQDPNSYKQLQDAPRLKSILKGASEDRQEPNTIDKIKEKSVPRTNPVNLIFVLSQYAPKVTELHFPPRRDFYDLIMRPSLTSASRARAFLWLMWHYLESDFTEEGAAENPFGAGVDYEVGCANQGVPALIKMSDEELRLENIDTPEEIRYGEQKMGERKRIIQADLAALQQAEFGPPKRGPKPKLNLPLEEGASPSVFRPRASKYDSDMDSTRSTPPPRGGTNMRISSVLNGSRARGKLVDSSSPAPAGGILLENGTIRKPRPLTAHQLAVEHNRNLRVNHILTRGLRKSHHESRRLRKTEGAILRAQPRTAELENWAEDSEGEESYSKPTGPFKERGMGGLVQLETEKDDFGEEFAAYAAAFRRAGRRFDRWDGPKQSVIDNKALVAVPIRNGADDDTEDEQMPMDEDNAVDDMDKEIMDVASEGEGDGEDDDDLDDVERTLLGLRGDETEEEISDGMDVD